MIEKIEDLHNITSKFDTKHINNLAPHKKVPENLLREIEFGCSLETLERLAAGFPVCKYETQLTIHGIFGDPKTDRIGQYKNLTRNKNLSLGVRWSAIDAYKKQKLYSFLTYKTGWIIEHNSQKYCIMKIQRVNSIEEAKKLYPEHKREIDEINTSLFWGRVSCYVAKCMWQLYIISEINILCFPVANFDEIIYNITGRTRQEIEAEADADAKAEEEKRQREAEDYEKQRKQRIKEIEREAEEWKAKNPIPDNFVKMENYTLKAGDVVTLGKIDTVQWCYIYFKIYNTKGRMFFKSCDQYGKACNMIPGRAAKATPIKSLWVKSK